MVLANATHGRGSCRHGPDFHVVCGLTADWTSKFRGLHDENVAIESVENPFGRMADQGAPQPRACDGTHYYDVSLLLINEARQGLGRVTL